MAGISALTAAGGGKKGALRARLTAYGRSGGVTAGVAENGARAVVSPPATFPATPHLTARICAMLPPNSSPRHGFCVRSGCFPDGGPEIDENG